MGANQITRHFVDSDRMKDKLFNFGVFAVNAALDQCCVLCVCIKCLMKTWGIRHHLLTSSSFVDFTFLHSLWEAQSSVRRVATDREDVNVRFSLKIKLLLEFGLYQIALCKQQHEVTVYVSRRWNSWGQVWEDDIMMEGEERKVETGGESLKN